MLERERERREEREEGEEREREGEERRGEQRRERGWESERDVPPRAQGHPCVLMSAACHMKRLINPINSGPNNGGRIAENAAVHRRQSCVRLVSL